MRGSSQTCLVAFGLLLAACASKSASDCDLDVALGPSDCAALHALSLPKEIPPAHGNAFADRLDAAQLGFGIFYDARFSANNNLRCASCHDPDKTFADRLPTSRGMGIVARNAPTILESVRSRWLFWDGRADSVWSQALVPVESPNELGFTRLALAHRIADSYRPYYEAIFGPLPPLDDLHRFPPSGMPGQAAWDGMSEADQISVNRVFANVGKSIEAFERRVVATSYPFDDFLAGKQAAIPAAAKRGIATFFKAGCLDCHGGPFFSDGLFHRVGFPDPDADSAKGRDRGIDLMLANAFNAGSQYYDGPAPPDFPPAKGAQDLGAFRTPSLRNVAATAPYGHAGQFASLTEVVSFHSQAAAGGPGGYGFFDSKLPAVTLRPEELADLVAFLGSLSGTKPTPPWDYWPNR